MSHYYSEKQDSIFKKTEFEDSLLGNRVKLISGSGVFSIGRIDNGTRLLIEKSIILEGSDVLDLGCGYGVVGIAIKLKHPSCEVFMSDINQRAVSLSRRNAKLNNVVVNIKQGDLYKPWDDKKFDTILTNPPYSAGRKICYGIIEGAKLHLKEGGTLQLVARHNKGGKTLSEKMETVFGNVETVEKKSGFRVYISENR